MLENIQEIVAVVASILALISGLVNVILMVKNGKANEAIKLLSTVIKDAKPTEKTKNRIKEMAEKLGIEGKINKIYTKFVKNDVFKKLLKTKEIWT